MTEKGCEASGRRGGGRGWRGNKKKKRNKEINFENDERVRVSGSQAIFGVKARIKMKE